jgi:hypothetical protein
VSTGGGAGGAGAGGAGSGAGGAGAASAGAAPFFRTARAVPRAARPPFGSDGFGGTVLCLMASSEVVWGLHTADTSDRVSTGIRLLHS